MAVQADGKVVIGGFFTDVDFRSRNSVARLNADGTLDLTFDPGDGANSAVYSVVIGPDGKPMIGGVFTSYNLTRRVGLARLLSSGSLDTSFLDTAYNQFAGVINGFSFLPPNFVRSISFETNGDLIIGGSFTNLGGNFSVQLNSIPGFTNVWTRQNKVTRFNVARLIGGYTPGPGNVEVAAPSFTIDENAGTLSLTLLRHDGRLGSVAQSYVTGDRIAQAGSDYSYTQSNAFWKQQGYSDPFGIELVPASVGYVGQSYFNISILDDNFIEGDESLNVNGGVPTGSIILGGEYIPLGAARGNSHSMVTIMDNDFQHGQFVFSSPQFSIGENNSVATITVLRTNGANGAVSVDYFTRDGLPPNGATNGLDYVAVSGTLNFDPGITSLTFSIPILNDSSVEPLDEYVQLILTNASGGATLPGGTSTSFASAILSIVDDDFPSGYLNFATSDFPANEGAPAQVTVTRRGGNSGALSVQVRSSVGTADTNDFTPGLVTLTWTNGDFSPKTFSIPLVDDGLVEPNETINLTLQNPSIPGAIGQTNTATITIVDNDSYGIFEFSRGNYEVEENGTNVTITVIRHDGQAGSVSVGLMVSNITATVGADYTTNGVPARLDFPPGVTARTFSIGMINDTSTEGLETIGLALYNPSSGAALGYTSNALVSIIDDEDSNIPAGSPDTTFDIGAGPNGAVYNLGLQRDGKIVIGGEFTSVDHSDRLRLARLLANGSLDPAYSAGTGVNRPIRAIAIQDDDKALIAGLFTQVQGTNFNHIARLNIDGSIDAFFNPGAGADNPIYALAVLPSGRILAGGAFTTFNGVSRPGIALLNTNGTLNSSFNPGVGFNGIVFALALQSDGKILVGGDFTSANNVPRSRIARLNADGSLDNSFNPGLGADKAVRVIKVQADGRILIGGSFTSINGTNRNYLARLNSDGSLDNTFLQDPSAGANDSIYALAIQFDGKIIVGGDFTTFTGVTRRRLTRLNADGKVDPTINFGGGANGAVVAIALQDDRRIIIGGAFTTFDDAPHNYVARLYGGSLAGPGAFQFTSATYNVNEFDGQAVITVRRKGGTRGQVQVEFGTADGSATAPQDYLAQAGSLSFPEGEVEQHFFVPIVNDLDIESVETVGLRLSRPQGGAKLGLQPTATLNIISDDSTIGFGSASFTASESAPSGHATITVVRSDATNTAVSVDLIVQNGTATAGLDYLLPAVRTLTFAPGEMIKTFQIPILSDTNVEDDETVLMSLDNATSSGNGIYEGITSAVLTIVDDDFAFGVLGFAQPQYSVTEAQTNAVITVFRNGGSDGFVSVDYTTQDGTALAGLDYTSTSGTLTFADGETAKSFAVPIIFDKQSEANETVLLSLFNVRGGATVGLTNATLIITNIDAAEGIRIIPAGAALIAESGPINGTLDTNEVVTFNLGLRNVGVLDTVQLGATLLSTNGVLALGTSSNFFGQLLAGGNTASKPYQFRVTASNGTRVTLVLKLQDGSINLGTATFDMFVGATSFTFSNTASITINDLLNPSTRGRATPYPSIIPISGLNGTVSAVSMSLYNMSHTYPGDIDILLVGPHGESVVVMSDAGSNTSDLTPINNVNLTFKDDYGVFLPETTQIVSGTYQPTNYGPVDSWPASLVPTDPSPPPNAPSRTRLLSPGGNQDPNGLWELFVMDDENGDSGQIAGGWSVTISMIGSGTAAADLGITTVTTPNQVTPGLDVTYAVFVTNYGPAKATGVVVSNVLDPAMTFIRSSLSTFTRASNVVMVTLPDLASGVGTNFVLTLHPNPGNTGITNTLFDTATVRANEIDLNVANNTAISKVIVYPVPQVSMTRKLTQVVLSWPAVGGGNFVVEATDRLVPANWSVVTNTPTLSGGLMSVTINPVKTNQFFRIRSP